MTTPAFAADITHRRAWAVWGVAVAAYVVAVANRTSMGVAGNVATDRFAINAAQLALLPVVQLVVYAGGQVPVGLLLDRWGSRLMVAIGAAVMAVGQLTLAMATTLPMALLGRVLVGAGDAMTFVSVVRLVPSWFSPRRVPLLTQLTGTVGQLGQVISAIPFAAVLHTRGWTSAFGSMAAIGVVSTVAVVLVVKDQPGRTRGTVAVAERAAARAGMPTTRESLKVVVREPVTWLAFWVHGMGQFSSHVIVLLWGVPYLVDGNNLSRAAASALLTLNVVVGAISGPIMGLIAGRHPRHRVTMALAVSVGTAVVWAIALIPPAPRPLWQMTLLVAVTALGGPASVIAFDVVRTSTEHRFLGTATGVVNTGGFTVGLLTMLAIGVVLDWSAGGNDRGPTDYRIAMSVIVVPIVVTTLGVLVTRARARAAHPGAAL